MIKDSNSNDLIIAPKNDINGADDNIILEVWCKVFQVRELASNI